tara:strand:- start:1134 stop:1580 length:447 start_codon:yes stop_codon:yes gene_type:complete
MIKLPEKLEENIEAYCKLNDVEDIEHFTIKCVKDGLTLDKYGVSPFLPKSQIQEVPVEKEVVKEVIKEILVEKEVIVEKIITKEVKDQHLIEELDKIKKELKEKNMLLQKQKIKVEEMEDVLEHFKQVTVNRRAKYLKTSNLNDTYID